MSTTAVIVIAVAAILLLGLVAWLAARGPRMRRERELNRRREIAATRHRDAAETVHDEARVAEQRATEARMQARHAEEQARLQRERAEVHQGRAELHEKGLADDELTDDEGRPLAEVDSQGSGYQAETRSRDIRDERDVTIGDDDRDGESNGRFTHDDRTTASRFEEELATGRPVDDPNRRPSTRE